MAPRSGAADGTGGYGCTGPFRALRSYCAAILPARRDARWWISAGARTAASLSLGPGRRLRDAGTPGRRGAVRSSGRAGSVLGAGRDRVGGLGPQVLLRLVRLDLSVDQETTRGDQGEQEQLLHGNRPSH